MGAGASASAAHEDMPVACTLKALPEAIETAVFVREKWPMIIDPTGQSGRFLRYQVTLFIPRFEFYSPVL